MKRELTFEEAYAVESLIKLVIDLGLFVDEEDGDFVHTTGEILNLESFDRENWEIVKSLVE